MGTGFYGSNDPTNSVTVISPSKKQKYKVLYRGGADFRFLLSSTMQTLSRPRIRGYIVVSWCTCLLPSFLILPTPEGWPG